MNYQLLLSQIDDVHKELQSEAAKSINTFLTIRNWLIGFYIVEFEQAGEDRAKYGANLLRKIAEDLQIKGLVQAELSRCRQFYNTYRFIGTSIQKRLEFDASSNILGTLSQDLENTAVQILGTPSQESQIDTLIAPDVLITKLSYSHFVELIKIENSLKRKFYEISAIRDSWSIRELKRQVASLFYERSGMNESPENLADLVSNTSENQTPSDLVKSVYAFDFLELNTQEFVEEKTLESALLNHLQEFILELGNGFCFEARQRRMVIDSQYYFADLVFYHRILKCHVIIELKVDEFKHSHLSQLNTYVSYYREEVMIESDNHPIGILLCTQKGEKLVEYALSGMSEKLFVSNYLVQLPSTEVLEKFIISETEKLKK